MNKFFGHLKTVLIHKYWVCYYCFQAGIPWQGITHDLSKFSPVEFFEGVKYYTGTHSPIDECKKKKGYSLAWQHHKGRNKHHYEYWVDNFDKGGEIISMPKKYLIEMLCDYLGAGRAYNGKNFSFKKELEWWNSVKNKRRIHSNNKRFLNFCFEYCVRFNTIPNKDALEIIYDSFNIISTENEPFNKDWSVIDEILRNQ